MASTLLAEASYIFFPIPPLISPPREYHSVCSALFVQPQYAKPLNSAAVREYVSVESILSAAAEKGEAPLIVVCDEISDPHNLGAIIRTAECAGAHGVVIPKRRSAGLTAVVAKTSAGAVSYLPVARVANLTALLKELKEEGLWVFGTAADGATSLYQADLKGPAARGVRPGQRAQQCRLARAVGADECGDPVALSGIAEKGCCARDDTRRRADSGGRTSGLGQAGPRHRRVRRVGPARDRRRVPPL